MDARTKYTSVLVAYRAGIATDLPAISPYARELARVPQTKDIPESALIHAFRTDPFLCAKVLGVANSIFFNFNHQVIYTLEDSLERVGFRYARNLLSEAPELPSGIDENQVCAYWAHCMSVAHVARKIAALATRPPFHQDVAYLVGLVHDIGYLLGFYCSPGMLSVVTQALEEGELQDQEHSHALHGEELARHWSLPLPAIAAIRTHHDPCVCEEERGRWLSHVIAVSEMLIGAIPHEKADLPETSLFTRCTCNLGISLASLNGLQAEGAHVYRDCIQVAAVARRGRFSGPVSLKAVK